jgi:hypothetical protein
LGSLSIHLTVCLSVSISPSISLSLTYVSLSSPLSIFLSTDEKFLAAEGADHFLLEIDFDIEERFAKKLDILFILVKISPSPLTITC